MVDKRLQTNENVYMENDTVVISVRVSRDLLTRFDAIAEKHRRKRGDLARIVLEDWTAGQESTQERSPTKESRKR
jgi:metal-responsive CopG/Arc/MetJ family transcriptional regulator